MFNLDFLEEPEPAGPYGSFPDALQPPRWPRPVAAAMAHHEPPSRTPTAPPSRPAPWYRVPSPAPEQPPAYNPSLENWRTPRKPNDPSLAGPSGTQGSNEGT
jgi:hypothetical protein